MHFNLLAVIFLPIGIVLAQTTFDVTVGEGGGLTYNPNTIVGAQAGDMIKFILSACSRRHFGLTMLT